MAESLSGLTAAFGLMLKDGANRTKPLMIETDVKAMLRAGLADADLQLLYQNGYLAHASGWYDSDTNPKRERGNLEEVGDGPEKRKAARTLETKSRRLNHFARVILTPPGAALAGQILFPLSDHRPLKRGFPDLTLPATPTWNEELQVLSWGENLIERFRRPAPNLVALIHALLKTNWATWTPSPFRSSLDRSGQSLLRDSIKNWNKSPTAKYVRLHSDGHGTASIGRDGCR